ncbi:unnamed protein product [Sphagnum troendelagicum]
MPLLTPYQLGPFHLSHRSKLLQHPATGFRFFHDLHHAAIYYAQRTTPGGLLIAEATAITEVAMAIPVLLASGQGSKLKLGSLWHQELHDIVLLRQTTSMNIHGTLVLFAFNQAAGSWRSAPQALTTDEIPQYVELYRIGAHNAIDVGFDGVDIHGAHGYSIDQFLKDGVNDRSDKYGGSVENQCRFALEVTDVVTKEIGSWRVGIRISPFADYADASDFDPVMLGIQLAHAFNPFNLLGLLFMLLSRSTNESPSTFKILSLVTLTTLPWTDTNAAADVKAT